MVVEPRPLAQLLLEDSDLRLEIFDDELLAVIHPTRMPDFFVGMLESAGGCQPGNC